MTAADLTRAKRALLAMLGGRWPDGAIEWENVSDIAATHRLEPMLAWRAQACLWPLPAAVSERWQASRRSSTLRALALKGALSDASSRLRAVGIEPVALKGVPLAWGHYPEPGLRPMRDLDLLVPAARASEATAVLTKAGYRPEVDDPAALADALAHDHQLPALHHPTLGVVIELHHRLGDLPARHGYRVPQLDSAAFTSRAVPLGDGLGQVRCAAPQDLAAHLIVHALYGHRLDCGPLVLADLHFMGKAVDWRALRQQAQAQGWERGADLLLTLVARWFGPPEAGYPTPPEDVLAAAEDALLPDLATRAHAAAVADIGAAASPAALGRALTRRLRPDAEVVAREGGGRALWRFWPGWALDRASRALRGALDPRIRGEASSAATVVRWVQG